MAATRRRTAPASNTRTSRARTHTKGTAVTSSNPTPEQEAETAEMARKVLAGEIAFEGAVMQTLGGTGSEVVVETPAPARKAAPRKRTAPRAKTAVAAPAPAPAPEVETPAPSGTIAARIAELRATVTKPKAAPKAAGSGAPRVARVAPRTAPEGKVEGEQEMCDLLAELRDAPDAGTTARLRRERDVLLDEIMERGQVSMAELVRRCFGIEAKPSSFTTAMQKRGAAIRAESEGTQEETPAPAPAPVAPAPKPASKVVPAKARVAAKVAK